MYNAWGYFIYFLLSLTQIISLFALMNNIIVLNDVCRSKTAMKISVVLPLVGRRVVLKLMLLAKKTKNWMTNNTFLKKWK